MASTELNIIKNPSKEQQQHANSIARKAGHGTATTVVAGAKNRVLDHIRYGYRKRTTGEYVSTAYLNNFGWKNTVYQSVQTIVEIDTRGYYGSH